MADLICCGAINWDINFFMDRLPRTGEEVPVNEIQRVSGGTAANVSVALGPVGRQIEGTGVAGAGTTAACYAYSSTR